MSDPAPDSNPYRSPADRAREDRETFPLRGQTYDMAMKMARDARRLRAERAAAATIAQAHERSGPERPRTGPRACERDRTGDEIQAGAYASWGLDREAMMRKLPGHYAAWESE